MVAAQPQHQGQQVNPTQPYSGTLVIIKKGIYQFDGDESV